MTRQNFGAQPWTYPQPVFIIATYNENGTADAMTVAWGGISGDTEMCLCLSAGHRTTANILREKAFTVSMADVAHVKECDYVGLVSANEVPDKLEKAGFHTQKATFINAPLITELPMTLECTLISYDSESCRLLANIVNVSADQSILTDGTIDVRKLRPITFDPLHNAYCIIGEQVGNAMSDGLSL